MTVRYAIAVHGGAGVNPSLDFSEVEAHLSDLIGQDGRRAERD